jgi:hypothetical protein
MARYQPLKPGVVPIVQPVPLSAEDRKRFSTWVDLTVAYNPIFNLPQLIGCVQIAFHFSGLTPRIMAAEHERTIKHLRREEQTGRRNNEIRARLQNPFCLDFNISEPCLPPLAANPDTSARELREAVEWCLEQTRAWPQGERLNTLWEAVRLAVMIISGWFRVAGRPELHADKIAERKFVFAVMAKAGLPTKGLCQNPARLYRDEILGPWFA